MNRYTNFTDHDNLNENNIVNYSTTLHRCNSASILAIGNAAMLFSEPRRISSNPNKPEKS